MKITIELTEAEVKGLKAYLKEVSDIPKPTAKDIKEQFDWKGWIYAPQEAVSDYIVDGKRAMSTDRKIIVDVYKTI